MKALIQRVKNASVTIDEKLCSKIDHGFLILLGIEKGDDEEKISWLVNKILNLRIFENEEGKMSKSVLDVDGEILVVSQFTLCADCKKGTRPSFDSAMAPKEASEMYDKFVKILSEKITVKTGVFGAMMDVELVNDGPVTIMLEK